MSIRLSESEYNKLINKTTKKSSKSKYHNKIIVEDGIRFDSKTEYERYKELKLFERANLISNLRYHDKSDKIILLDDPLIEYEPDFCYDENGQHIIEDVKGYQTKEFKLKKKMIIAKIKSGQLDAVFIITKKENGTFIKL